MNESPPKIDRRKICRWWMSRHTVKSNVSCRCCGKMKKSSKAYSPALVAWLSQRTLRKFQLYLPKYTQQYVHRRTNCCHEQNITHKQHKKNEKNELSLKFHFITFFVMAFFVCCSPDVHIVQRFILVWLSVFFFVLFSINEILPGSVWQVYLLSIYSFVLTQERA